MTPDSLGGAEQSSKISGRGSSPLRAKLRKLDREIGEMQREIPYWFLLKEPAREQVKLGKLDQERKAIRNQIKGY